MVTAEVWAAGGLAPTGGLLCVACLEMRLGRPLVSNDLPNLPINDSSSARYQSVRLRAALAREDDHSVGIEDIVAVLLPHRLNKRGDDVYRIAHPDDVYPVILKLEPLTYGRGCELALCGAVGGDGDLGCERLAYHDGAHATVNTYVKGTPQPITFELCSCVSIMGMSECQHTPDGVMIDMIDPELTIMIAPDIEVR